MISELTIDNAADKPEAPVPNRSVAKPTVRARIVEKIRSELNIEKWPAIWQPAKSKNKPVLRVMERETVAAGGRVVSRVEVGFTHLGTLTTEEQKMLYVLIKLWEDSGKPDTQVFFSTRGLARLLKKKGWGTNVIHAITKSLRKLRTIPIEWINSYYDQTKQGAVMVDRRPFTLLGELRIVERLQDGAVNSSQGYFKFDDHVLSNLQLNYTKPVCIEEFFKLKSEIAQLIYSHVDLMLYDKTRYERRSKELFDDLGLKNPEYAHMYERKRAIEKALKELSGIRLSSGVLRSAGIEKTTDGKDYKVGFSKGTAAAIDSAVEEKLPGPAMAGVVINDYSKAKDPTLLDAEELVQLFYRRFHGVEKHEAQSKETSQALAVITQYGLEKAKHLVEFAFSTSPETKYRPQTFGGILQFTSRANADFEKSKRSVRTSPVARPVLPADDGISSPQFPTGERRFLALSAEQLVMYAETAKEQLLREQPFLAGRWKAGSAIHETMIRARIIRYLDQQPMELVPPGFYDCLPGHLRPTAGAGLDFQNPRTQNLAL